MASNGAQQANTPNAGIEQATLTLEVTPSPLLTPLPQTALLPGKLFWVRKVTVKSANPTIPFASFLAIYCCDNEKVLWERNVVVPLGADGKTCAMNPSFTVSPQHQSSKP